MKKLFYILLFLPFTFFGQAFNCQELDFSHSGFSTSGQGIYFTQSVTSQIHAQLGNGIIGVFYDDGAIPKCGGFGNLNSGEPISFTVFGDDSYTPEKEGFLFGEQVTIFYKTSNGSVINIIPQSEITYIPNGIAIIGFVNLSSCGVLYGCVEESALNYNIFATEDDGSCLPGVNGCTDAIVFNFNVNANTDDGSCTEIVEGCMDATAFNYDLDANTDDGSCIAVLNGCTDANASNYNSLANTENGSCVSWEEFSDSLQSELDNVVSECEEVATQNIPLDLPQGWSMFGYTCLESLDVVEAFSGISNNIEIVKDEWGLAYLPAWGFSAFDNLEFGEGYQIKMMEEVTDFQFCTTIAGGASQDELDAAYLEGAASVTPEDGIGQSDVDSASQDGYNLGYADGSASVTPEDGITQEDVDAAFDEGAASVTPEDGVSQSDLDALADSYAGYTAPLNLQIGDQHKGGIVFQINEDGSGLVAALEDAVQLPFFNGDVCNWYHAVGQASNYSSEEYTGWHLPSIEELWLMYSSIGQGSSGGNIGGFEDGRYWSSSATTGTAMVLDFNIDITDNPGVAFWNEYALDSNTWNQYRVRFVRAF